MLRQVDFDRLLRREIPPPFSPLIRGQAADFDFELQPRQERSADSTSLMMTTLGVLGELAPVGKDFQAFDYDPAFELIVSQGAGVASGVFH
jgi:hypothetical protein